MQQNAEQKKTAARGRTIRQIIVVVFVLAAVIIARGSFAATQGPIAPPTSPALPTFLNVSSTDQAKAGWLGLGMPTAATAPTAALDVKGTMISDVLGILGTAWISEKLHIGGTTAASIATLATDPALTVQGTRIQSTILAGTGERLLCADDQGRLVICGSTTPTPVDAACGVAAVRPDNSRGADYNTFDFSNIANPYLCESGNPQLPVNSVGNTVNYATGLTDLAYMTWTCKGINGGHDASCASQGACLIPQTSCFIAGTPITLADGTTQPIETIKTGETVMTSANKDSSQVSNFITLDYDGWVYGFNGGKPFVTDSHPFMTTDGWKSFDPAETAHENTGLTKIGKLQVGDTLIKEGGVQEKILSVNRVWKKTKVYNLTVQGAHQYYADGYLVHNKQSVACGTPPPPPTPPAPPAPILPICGGTLQAPVCNLPSWGISVTLRTSTVMPGPYCHMGGNGPGIWNVCDITTTSTNYLGNHIVQSVVCSDPCEE